VNKDEYINPAAGCHYCQDYGVPPMLIGHYTNFVTVLVEDILLYSNTFSDSSALICCIKWASGHIRLQDHYAALLYIVISARSTKSQIRQVNQNC